MITFPFNKRKAIQAGRYIWEHEYANSIPSIVGLLYLVDREVLKTRGRTITTDQMVLTPDGLGLYNSPELLFKELYCFKNVDFSNLGTDEMSRYDMDTLDEIADRHNGYDEPDNIKYALETLPEYKKVTSTILVDPAEILRLEGVSEADIKIVQQDAEEQMFMSTLGLL